VPLSTSIIRGRGSLEGGLVPQPLEPPSAGARVTCRVPDVLVPEVVLDQAQVGHLGAIGKVIAARVTQHVRPHVTELSARSSLADDVGEALTGELLSTLGRVGCSCG
jgi:hypothetical protein